MDTHTTHALPAPAPALARPARGRSPNRGLAAIIAGAVLALAGLSIAAVGGGVLALFGGDDTATSDRTSYSTTSTALVSGIADVDGVSDLDDFVGDTRAKVTVQSTGTTDGLFVGIGPAADVDRYLAGAAIDEATDIDLEGDLERERRPGSARPAPPGAQDFWVAKGTGADEAALDWKVRDGDYRVVVMNQDGSRGVDADGRLGVTAPNMPEIAWTVFGVGLALLAGGAAAIAIGAVRRKD
jgi:hypothetical protein